MANLKNTTITGTGHLTLPANSTAVRPSLVTTITSFTSVGTTSWTCPAGVTSVEVLVVAGGGGGGGGFDTWAGGGGGGAGGVVYRSNFPVTPATVYTVTVGGGGAGATGSSPRVGSSGSNSVFGSLIATGGGGGGGWLTGGSASNATSGGSGGGGANASGSSAGAAGTNNQGFAGGDGHPYTGTNGSSGGGGGGAGGKGSNGNQGIGGGGGYGLVFDITGSLAIYAAGGGGGGGTYGGGSQNGGRGGNGLASSGASATANTGGGGGGGGSTAGSGVNASTNGGAGGSGIVVLRYTLDTSGNLPVGKIRYNTDANEVEVFDNQLVKWRAQDPTKNFAGHNVLTYSEQADSSAWTKNASNITANAAVAPDGTSTADKLYENTANSNHYIVQGFSAAANTVWCASFYAKPAGRNKIGFSFSSYVNWVGGGGCETVIDLTSQTFTFNSSTPTGYGIIDAGNGWYRVYITGTTTAAISSNFVLYTADASGNLSYTGDGTSGTYIWGMQLEQGVRTPGPYTRTVSANAPTPADIGGWRIHSYTNTGTSSFKPALTGVVEVLVVGGGGGAGTDVGGGGGGGGVIYNQTYPVIAEQPYTVTVGAGGSSGSNNGEDSRFGNLVAIGGGGGGYYYDRIGRNGGSGGGAGGNGPNTSARVSGATMGGEGTYGQGHRGGNLVGGFGGAGGGGAGGRGFDQNGYGADGGQGLPFDISGALTYYGGGGGGGDSSTGGIGRGGIGGGGDGDQRNAATANLRVSGLANTGGGGGGDGGWTQVGSGGSGIVIVRYRS